MTRLASLLVLAALTLTACASPEQRCVNAATRDLNTVDRLIAETRANLDRGYALETDIQVRNRLTFCAGRYGHRGRGYSYGGFSFCTSPDLVERNRPVAIDPQAERRKLANLERRRQGLEVAARQAIAACGV